MIYDFRCAKCKTVFEVVCTLEDHEDVIWHCAQRAEQLISSAPMVAPSFKPYQAITGDRRMVHDQAQHKAFLKDFNLVEIGDDKSMAPPIVSRDEIEALKKIQQSDLQQLEDAPTIADV
jgi:hypothetical protein